MSGAGFLARWSRRKAGLDESPADLPPAEASTPEPAPPEPAPPDPPAATVAEASPPPPLPTLADVARLGADADFAPFMARGVDATVQRAALKKLFADPHFNVMDGLDTYIDDYGRPDPIPLAVLRRMTQSAALRLFETEADPAPAPATEVAPAPPLESSDDDPDLRLQQDHAAGPGGTGPDARP